MSILSPSQALEDLGILQKCRRFAGSSAGAMTSSMLALGMKADDIMKLQLQNLEPIFQGGHHFFCILGNDIC